MAKGKPPSGGQGAETVARVIGWLILAGVAVGLVGFGWQFLCTVLLIPAGIFMWNLAGWLLDGPGEAS